ncbi:hypothetical protein [Thauera sp.]|uniref:hypothetical protein n=1 Tax=Thauera sp. TaxID=1905334 RepID=UPI002B5DBA19|nr:hypothetical protein [Thauera sp.]HRP26387.1 hypothetical protein [Thauera sp.]
MTFADAFDNMRNVTARVLDRMIEAGIPAYEARELLRDLSDAEIALRQSFTPRQPARGVPRQRRILSSSCRAGAAQSPAKGFPTNARRPQNQHHRRADPGQPRLHRQHHRTRLMRGMFYGLPISLALWALILMTVAKLAGWM